MKTLNVKEVTKKQVENKWSLKLPVHFDNILYIRCNSKGKVNWCKSSVYQKSELEKRGNYNII